MSYFAVLATVNNKHDLVYLAKAASAEEARSSIFDRYVSLVPGERITDVIPLPQLEERAWSGYFNPEYPPKDETPTVVVQIEGGAVQWVYTNAPQTKVVILDYDREPEDRTYEEVPQPLNALEDDIKEEVRQALE